MALAGPGDLAGGRSGLRYASDEKPGIRRRRAGRGFAYATPSGEPLTDPTDLNRIRTLVIPPAWRDVWICPSPRGHVQATGRDMRGRKQYIYHPRWRELRDDTKFDRMADLGARLPGLRMRVDGDLRRHGLGRERVLAAVVRLLERTLIRVGNGEYARLNGSFGLTTLKRAHVTVEGATVRFRFRGKGGREHRITVRDARAARVIERCRAVRGPALFQWLDGDGVTHAIRSADVNAYIREATGGDFTAKDIRTWHASIFALELCAELAAPSSDAEARRKLASVVSTVAARLGNTPAVCRQSYIHPSVLESYADGTLRERVSGTRRRQGLGLGEARFLRFLTQPGA